METKFQTSFIPKTTLEPVQSRAKKPIGLFAFIATVIFFISAVVAGGAFGWHKFLERQKVLKKDNLEANINKFEPNEIQRYVRLDNRINAAKDLLAKHVAVSYIFDFLQDQTLKSVGFSDFKYSVASDGSATLSLNGIAKSYNAVAYQATVFGRERALIGPIFSNLDVDNVGDVVFNFSTNVNSGFIAYTRKAIEEEAINTDIDALGEGFNEPTFQMSATSTDETDKSASSTSASSTKSVTKPK
jgi:nitrate reductase NapE component